MAETEWRAKMVPGTTRRHGWKVTRGDEHSFTYLTKEEAHLIAAAKEMQGALEAVLDTPITHGKALKTVRLRERIRAALAKSRPKP